MLKAFRDSPYFLLKYHALNITFYATGSILLYSYHSDVKFIHNGWILFAYIFLMVLPSFKLMTLSALGIIPMAITFHLIEPQLWHLVFLPLGMALGLTSSFLMHNTTHKSLGPGWFNRLVGEVSGLHQLMGYPAWAIAHIIHHQYPDDPTKDPHPPEGLTFIAFSNQMGASMARVMTAHFFERWGNKPEVKRLWGLTILFSATDRYLKGIFLLLLAGPQLFVLLLVPSKFWCILFYVHFNYYTHRPNQKGETEILNLDHTWGYKILNSLTWGSYYHKNHHKNPSLFDPRKFKQKQYARPMLRQTVPTREKVETFEAQVLRTKD